MTTLVTTGSTGSGSSSGSTTPEITTGNDVPTEATGPADTSDTTTSDTTTTDDRTGEPIDCPETVPAPIDCGAVPEACGGATPIAGGPGLFVQGSALTHDHVWFHLFVPTNCPAALYRAPKVGGDAQRMRPTQQMIDFESDDDAVYFVDRTEDPYTLRLRAWVDGTEIVLGDTHGDPRYNVYFLTFLSRSRGGVVTFTSGGPKNPPFHHLTPAALTLVGFEADDVYLGSEPAYDGEHVFYTLSDPAFDDEPGHISVDGQLVVHIDGASVVLAGGATTRGEPTVAVDAEYVYFATGAPGRGISRISRAGGMAVELFAERDDGAIDKVLVDETHVYYHHAPHGIYAVEKSGGAPRHVWHGEHNVLSARIQQDVDHLYFSVDSSGGDIPEPGRDFVVRVAKAAEIP